MLFDIAAVTFTEGVVVAVREKLHPKGAFIGNPSHRGAPAHIEMGGAASGMNEVISAVKRGGDDLQTAMAAVNLSQPGHIGGPVVDERRCYRLDGMGPVIGNQSSLHHGDDCVCLFAVVFPQKRRGPTKINRLIRFDERIQFRIEPTGSFFEPVRSGEAQGQKTSLILPVGINNFPAVAYSRVDFFPVDAESIGKGKRNFLSIQKQRDGGTERRVLFPGIAVVCDRDGIRIRIKLRENVFCSNLQIHR